MCLTLPVPPKCESFGDQGALTARFTEHGDRRDRSHRPAGRAGRAETGRQRHEAAAGGSSSAASVPPDILLDPTLVDEMGCNVLILIARLFRRASVLGGPD